MKTKAKMKSIPFTTNLKGICSAPSGSSVVPAYTGAHSTPNQQASVTFLGWGILFLGLIFLSNVATAQPDRWQQKIKYEMNIQVEAEKNQFKGDQKLTYWNNSPDTLHQLYFHLYWNAFQPGSMMDVRSQELGKNQINGRPDWDGRVRDRIASLKPNEIGYQNVQTVLVNGRPQKTRLHETILEVILDQPILPRSETTIETKFDAQVPVQIRRSGRDNAEGIRLSMAQWYPKLCEYDRDGWHPNPYIAREFYGVWGDFDVKITIDKNYVLGGTGYLQNANDIGFGYQDPGVVVKPTKDAVRTWHFFAPNVHDFMWAADPTYKVVRKDMPKGGPSLFVLYKPSNAKQDAAWEKIVEAAAAVLPFIEKNFGAYPYKQYSFIQGGDGGMEYPMSTLLKGPGLGTVFHEWMHSWYQMMMGTNESLFALMDEGFTSYAESLVSAYYKSLTNETAEKGSVRTGPANNQTEAALPLYHAGAYRSYMMLAKSGLEEPLATHADHFNTNIGYSIAAYSKGQVFMSQLGYIVGDQIRDKILLEYYQQWRFKHPNIDDFIRIAEKESRLKLDWYKMYWVYTTKTIDYAVGKVTGEKNKTRIELERIGKMPMPIDVEITYKDGTKSHHYFPLSLMYGDKPHEFPNISRTVYEPWKWTHPTYTFTVEKPLSDIVSIEIDPSRRMADLELTNNKWGK